MFRWNRERFLCFAEADVGRSMSLATDIKEFASEIGFHLVGVGAASHLSDTESIMLARIRDGFMGELGWFTPGRVERACNLSLLLSSAASVISLAASYLAERPNHHQDSSAPRGRISRYSWSEDYHSAMGDQMQILARFIAERVKRAVDVKTFVDSGPIAERELARRSGLGWFGKSTNVLTRGFGSWVFLGEIVTSLELEVDSPSKGSCGKCDACLRACPTGAIVAPYTLDARRCISYLTIELKGAIPRELRPLVGDWIFGCDVCQEVCPVNKKAKVPERSPLVPLEDFDPQPSLLDILKMSDEEYRATFRRSPVRRAKKRGLQRNAAVALGNCGDPAVVPYLIESLDNPDELVRGHVVWALGRLGGRLARTALESHRARESSDFVIEELEAASMCLETISNRGAWAHTR